MSLAVDYILKLLASVVLFIVIGTNTLLENGNINKKERNIGIFLIIVGYFFNLTITIDLLKSLNTTTDSIVGGVFVVAVIAILGAISLYIANLNKYKLLNKTGLLWLSIMTAFWSVGFPIFLKVLMILFKLI